MRKQCDQVIEKMMKKYSIGKLQANIYFKQIMEKSLAGTFDFCFWLNDLGISVEEYFEESK